MSKDFRKQDLKQADIEIYNLIEQENKRQKKHIELIASENFVSKAVMQAQGSCLTNKYAEGYPGKRYYQGCEHVDEVENLAIERIKKLFNCNYANVQPHSGSQANQAVFLALLNPGDVILSMSMNSGGHLTHGAAPNLSGKWFNIVNYNVDPSSFLIDYNAIEELAIRHKPKLIIAGYSCYPRKLDFKIFRQIADKVGAYLLADVAHIAGIIAADLHESPLPYAHAVTATTHKTLRGPRGGIILSNDEQLGKKFNSAVFPGLQGGPLMHVIAAKAVAFGEALTGSYKEYMRQTLANAKILAEVLQNEGHNVLTGGTDNHMVILDLRPDKITGKDCSKALELAYITCNKNAVPFDEVSPFITSGIRLGAPACTSLGFIEEDFHKIGKIISFIIKNIGKSINAGEDLYIAMEKIIPYISEDVRLLMSKIASE